MRFLLLLAVFGSFGLSLILTALVRVWARQVGFVDRPGGHKQHDRPVALGGGIALFLSILAPIVAATVLAYLVQANPPWWVPAAVHEHLPGIASKLRSVLGIAGGALVLHVMGLVDDRRPLGAGIKFAAQFAVAIFVAGPLGIRAVEALPAAASIGLTVLWIVVITNAFNFLDNMDGLSAGVAALAAAIFGLSATNAGQLFVPVTAFVIAGGALGFLCFNFSPATIFMGDAGSLVLGYLLSVVTILTTFYDPSLDFTPLGVFVPMLVLAVPLYDVLSVVFRRVRAGKSPFRGDRGHFSHRLVRRGMSPRGAVLTIYLATAATGLPAIVLPKLKDWTDASLLFVQCACVVAMIAILEGAGERAGEAPCPSGNGDE
jgi:UDP-GlcNAc:undecaprenyl-phosphate GlcNAc-1-phosphate transferase